jgi:hypothetical protein
VNRPTLFVLVSLVATLAHSNELCEAVKGAVVIAQDDKNTYLGKISNSYVSESIFNEFGTYGSPYNSLSVWNEYGTFGSTYNRHSATNPYTSTPPMIIKDRKVLGYLSANRDLRGSITPNLLKALCKDDL